MIGEMLENKPGMYDGNGISGGREVMCLIKGGRCWGWLELVWEDPVNFLIRPSRFGDKYGDW